MKLKLRFLAMGTILFLLGLGLGAGLNCGRLDPRVLPGRRLGAQPSISDGVGP